MKKVLVILAATAFLAACSNEKKDDTKPADAATAKPAADVKLAYVPAYSSSFEIGNAAHAAMIVQGSWKDWEMNTIGDMKNWVADTIVAFMAGNEMVRGVDSLAAAWKRNRAYYTSVKDTVHAVIPVYSTDKKENWVLVWAKEINVNSKGVKDTVEVMETWRINKDGKADMLLQFDRHKRKQ